MTVAPVLSLLLLIFSPPFLLPPPPYSIPIASDNPIGRTEMARLVAEQRLLLERLGREHAGLGAQLESTRLELDGLLLGRDTLTGPLRLPLHSPPDPLTWGH